MLAQPAILSKSVLENTIPIIKDLQEGLEIVYLSTVKNFRLKNKL